MAKAKRPGTSKRIRFEVFKRDSFTCQYCGKKAPDVILHVDHIDPVSKGGGNEIINLITSCVDCNAGKSNVRISDDSALTKQRAQLEELNERREQLEMMLRWREGLSSMKEDLVEEIEKSITKVTGWSLNENGKRGASKMLREFGLPAVLDAIEISADRYLERDQNGKVTQESFERFFKKIGGICAVRRLPEHERKLRYIRGIMNNRMSYMRHDDATVILERAYEGGLSLEYLEKLAKRASHWSQWVDWMEEAMKEAGID